MNEPAPGSRYRGLRVLEHPGADGRPVRYREVRLLPEPGPAMGHHEMREDERLDHVAFAHLGDPLLYWALCDANGALAPEALERAGHRLRVPAPWEAPP